MISPSRMRPIHVLDPATRRCQKGAGRSCPSSSTSGSSAGAVVVTSLMPASPSCVMAPVMAPTTSSIVTLAAREARDARAQAQDLDAVGHLEDLGHVVADEDDREPLLAHARR